MITSKTPQTKNDLTDDVPALIDGTDKTVEERPPSESTSEKTATQHPSANLQRLFHWLKAHGAKMPGIEIRTRDGMRGVYARYRIVRGAVVMYLPRCLHMTSREAKTVPLVKQLQAANLSMDDQNLIALLLIHTRRHGGFWQPYVESLPQGIEDYSGVPMFFPKSEFALLKGTMVHRITTERWNLIKHEYRDIRARLSKAERFGFREFLWAQATVASRSYGQKVDGVDTSGLVPLADFFNHAFDDDVTRSHRADALSDSMEYTHGFYVTTLRQIGAWKEIRINYGALSNSRLLTFYGFCLDENPYDEADAWLPFVDPSNPYLILVRDMGDHRGFSRYFLINKSSVSPKTQQLFSFLRLSCLPKATERPSVQEVKNIKDKHQRIPPLSQENETAVLRQLVAISSVRRFSSPPIITL